MEFTTTPESEQKRLSCSADLPCFSRCTALGRAGLTFKEPKPTDDCGVLAKLDDLSTDEDQRIALIAGGLSEHMKEYADSAAERENIVEIKTGYQNVFDAHNALYANLLDARRQGVEATPEELEYFQSQIELAQKKLDDLAAGLTKAEILLAQAAFDRQTLDDFGIVFTSDMQTAIERMITNVYTGKPALLKGDKGISKTGAAKYLSRLIEPSKDPLIISGHGDLMAHELIGHTTQDETKPDGVHLIFKYGKFIQAAEEGRPVLIDEMNFADQSVMARINDFMLLRPGDALSIQENGGREIIIQPGFVIFMTANIGNRYQNRQTLDLAFRDRADILAFGYPDPSKNPLEDDMPNTLRLAFAAATNREGWISPHIDIGDLLYLARVAHVSQQLYSQPAKLLQGINHSGGVVASALDDEPAMTDCITPRTMIETIRKCQGGNLPGVNLSSEIDRLIETLDDSGGANARIIRSNVKQRKVN